ncbi:hypothetical protein HDU67_005463 [Dinochytrium kinnereticum]|nr:hypothetical protein HDU67_005463 [Dinochytrium kinnereticum]
MADIVNVCGTSPQSPNLPVILSLTLASRNLVGPIPPTFSQLQSLQTLNLAANPGITGNISALASLSNLQTLNLAGCSGIEGSLPSNLPASLVSCQLDQTRLCGAVPEGSGICRSQTPAVLPSCPSDPSSNSTTSTVPSEQPSSQSSPSANANTNVAQYPLPGPALWITIAVVVFLVILMLSMCVACSSSRRNTLKRQYLLGEATRSHHSRRPSASSRTSLSLSTPSDLEMAMITLKRSGPPPRTFSLPDRRAALTPEEKAMDDRACIPFMDANTPRGSNVFPVRRPHVKGSSDEIPLVEGETVVVLRVFRDGWCEGVSRRAGGPACFPLACLGGGVPVVLAQRMTSILAVVGGEEGQWRGERGAPAPPVPGVPMQFVVAQGGESNGVERVVTERTGGAGRGRALPELPSPVEAESGGTLLLDQVLGLGKGAGRQRGGV